MTSFVTAAVLFPAGRLAEEFIATYLDRYTVDTSGGVTLDGVGVTLSPSKQETDTLLSTIYPDNGPLTRYRKASIFDGTISMLPVYDNGDPETGALIGHTITCGWPEQFLLDIASPPPDIADLFDGVHVVAP